MQEKNDFKMKPALDVNQIYPKLLEIGISQTDINYLNRDEEWKSIQFRNHQIYFLREKFNDISGRQLTIKELMSIFNLTETPVKRAINGGFKLPEEPGRHAKLKDEDEKFLVDLIIDREKLENPITESEFRMFVHEKYKIPATSGWLQAFLLRHSNEVQRAKSFPLNDNRCTVPYEYLIRHIENMHNYVENCCAELVFNVDEMGSSEWEDRKPRKVLVAKTSNPQSIFHKVSRRYKHETLVSIVPAAGESLTPMLITSSNVFKQLKEVGYRHHDAAFRVRKSPYIDEELFIDYLNTIFFPYIDSLMEKEEFMNQICVLLMDSYSSHVTSQVLQLLAQKNVRAITFPAHTTNIFQMLDLVFFGSLKKILQTEESEIDPKHAANFADRLLKAFESTMIPPNVRGSFKRGGFILNVDENPSKVIFDETILEQSEAFKELCAANISVEQLSTRRQNQTFGWINQQYFTQL